MKASKEFEIVKEELKSAGLDIAEEVLEGLVHVICEKVAPRLVLESDKAVIKSAAGLLVTMYPTLKPAIDKATDLNKDGK